MDRRPPRTRAAVLGSLATLLLFNAAWAQRTPPTSSTSEPSSRARGAGGSVVGPAAAGSLAYADLRVAERLFAPPPLPDGPRPATGRCACQPAEAPPPGVVHLAPGVDLSRGGRRPGAETAAPRPLPQDSSASGDASPMLPAAEPGLLPRHMHLVPIDAARTGAADRAAADSDLLDLAPPPVEPPRAAAQGGEAERAPSPDPRRLPPVDAGGHEDEADLPSGAGRSADARTVDPSRCQRIEAQLAPHVARAERLAAWGACYAAHAELLQALVLYAQALDGPCATREHEESLRRALCAMRESRDLAPATARPRDLDYAQQQLAASCGYQAGASRLFYLLGRVSTEMDRATFLRAATYLPQAVVMHRAALRIDPGNALAANELGVLCARFQQWDEAQRLLLHSAATCPVPETWHNLSVVHEQLGQLELARRAAEQSRIVAAQHAESAAGVPGPVPADASGLPLAPSGMVEPTEEAGCPGGATGLPWPGAWQTTAPGAHAGPLRDADAPPYRLRVDDQLELVYQLLRAESGPPYRLQIGDRIRVESGTDASLHRDLVVQPDGMITVPLLGQIRAARRTVVELRDELEAGYAAYQKVPAITVTPVAMNAPWEELRGAIAGPGASSPTLPCRVAPDGTVQLPLLGSVPAHGLTLDELRQEIEARYAVLLQGVGVTPRLVARAPRYVFVAGEVRKAGRYCLTGPTTALQAVTLAGGACPTGLTQHVAVFRRLDDEQLMTLCVNLQPALQGRCAGAAADVWVCDGDVVIVPKKACWRADKRLDWNLLRSLLRSLPLPGRTVSVCRPSTL